MSEIAVSPGTVSRAWETTPGIGAPSAGSVPERGPSGPDSALGLVLHPAKPPIMLASAMEMMLLVLGVTITAPTNSNGSETTRFRFAEATGADP